MKKLFILCTTIVIVLSMVAIVIGCKEESEPAPLPPTPTPIPSTTPVLNTGISGIDLALANFAKGYETKDIDLLKGCLAEESSFYSELVINAQNTFTRYEKIDMEFSDPTINLYDDGKRATVNLKETFKGIGEEGRITEEISSRDIFELIKSKAGWTIISWYRDIYMRELPNEGREKE